MSVSVTMPRLGESVTEGTVTRWLKNEGDRVEADEPLLEVSTDKVDTEVPSPASGVLSSIKVREDETVDIGVELAVIGDEGDQAQSDGAESSSPDSSAASESAPSESAAVAEAVAPEPEAEPEPQPASPSEPARAEAAAPAPSTTAVVGGGGTDEDEVAGTYVTPLVRKLASEYRVDLSTIQGTGVGGRIRKSDVLAAAEKSPGADGARAAAPAPPSAAAPPAAAPAAAPPPAAAPAPAVAPTAATPAAVPSAAPAAAAPAVGRSPRGRIEKLTRRRQLIAARMVESLRVSAQLTTVVEVDVTRIARLREAGKQAFEAREGVKLTFLPFFAAATVEALKLHPVLNASIDTDAGTITYHDAEHLGIAVDTEAGLTVPVIHNAGDLNLGGLARKIADLAERTRTNKISPDELGGGTFTLTNTGSRGALFDTPIINQPQVGILGTGIVVKRPVVMNDPDLGETIAVRSMVYLALSYDHRIVDGADAARFLSTLKERLEGGKYERALGLS
jgi:pyruvate dehydrogenase E2 component (dihydrolipoamide acetyltransferase)